MCSPGSSGNWLAAAEVDSSRSGLLQVRCRDVAQTFPTSTLQIVFVVRLRLVGRRHCLQHIHVQQAPAARCFRAARVLSGRSLLSGSDVLLSKPCAVARETAAEICAITAPLDPQCRCGSQSCIRCGPPRRPERALPGDGRFVCAKEQGRHGSLSMPVLDVRPCHALGRRLRCSMVVPRSRPVSSSSIQDDKDGIGCAGPAGPGAATVCISVVDVLVVFVASPL